MTVFVYQNKNGQLFHEKYHGFLNKSLLYFNVVEEVIL